MVTKHVSSFNDEEEVSIENQALLTSTGCSIHTDRKRLYRAVIYLGVCFSLIFTAYNTVQSYVTTLYPGLGFYILLVAYANFGVSSLLASRIHVLVGRCVANGSVEKIVMGVASVLYVIFIVSAATANEFLAFSGAVLVGWGSGFLWISQGVYLTKLVMGYNDALILGTMTGIFFSIYNLNSLVGNSIALIYLYFGGDLSNLVYIMSGVGVLATLMMIKLQSTKSPEETVEVVEISSSSIDFKLLKSFVSKRSTLLLAPYCLNAGIAIAFVSGNFPTYVTYSTKVCGGTVQDANINVAWTSLIYGVGGIFGSFVSGRMYDYFERRLTPLIFTHLLLSITIFSMASAVIISDEIVYPVSVFPVLMLVSFIFGASDFLMTAIINSSISTFYAGKELVWGFSGYRVLFCIGFVFHAALSGSLPGVYDYNQGSGLTKYGWLVPVVLNLIMTFISVICAHLLSRTPNIRLP